MNQNAKKYFYMLKHKIPYVPKMKATYLSSIQLSIASYLDENPAATMTDLYNEIGTIDDLCEAYKDELTPEQLTASSQRNKRISLGITLLSILILSFCIYLIWSLYTSLPVGFSTTITIK